MGEGGRSELSHGSGGRRTCPHGNKEHSRRPWQGRRFARTRLNAPTSPCLQRCLDIQACRRRMAGGGPDDTAHRDPTAGLPSAVELRTAAWRMPRCCRARYRGCLQTDGTTC